VVPGLVGAAAASGVMRLMLKIARDGGGRATSLPCHVNARVARRNQGFTRTRSLPLACNLDDLFHSYQTQEDQHDHLPSVTLCQSRSTLDPWRQSLGVGFWSKGLCQARTLETIAYTLGTGCMELYVWLASRWTDQVICVFS
jgi:hypothetical protein